MDYVNLVLIGLGTTSVALLLLFLLGLRSLSVQIAPVVGMIGAFHNDPTAFLSNFLYVVEETTDEKGVVSKTKRVNPQIQEAVEAIVPAVMPMMIQQGMQWAAKNMKFKPGGGGPGGEGLGGLSSLLMPMLPKQFRSLAPLLEPLIAKFIPGISTSSGGVGGKGGEGPLPPGAHG